VTASTEKHGPEPGLRQQCSTAKVVADYTARPRSTNERTIVATKIVIKDEALKTWVGLNAELTTANEDRCNDLLKKELAGRRRLMFLLRIHSRLNKERAARERLELEAKAVAK
jgi:hypothetical protein